jgi:hypothetical protein
MWHVSVKIKQCSYYTTLHISQYLITIEDASNNNVTDLINALPGSVNTAQHVTMNEAVFSVSSAPSSGGTTELCNPLLSNGSVNTFPRVGPCYETGDVINNREGVRCFPRGPCRGVILKTIGAKSLSILGRR